MQTLMTPSYVHGGSDQPLSGETIGACLDRIARAARRARSADRAPPEHPLDLRAAAVELDQQSRRRPARLGLQPGERVGIWSPNNAEWVLTQFATAKAGPDPGQHQSRPIAARELEYALNKVAAAR